MPLTTKIYEHPTNYILAITDGAEEFKYLFPKNPPEGQDLSTYLQNCKREAELLAQLEIDKKAPPKEIVL